jgi:putative transposase
MRKSKFTDAQIAFVLRQAGISEATFDNWRKTDGGLMPSEMRGLKQLEEGWRHCLRPAS